MSFSRLSPIHFTICSLTAISSFDGAGDVLDLLHGSFHVNALFKVRLLVWLLGLVSTCLEVLLVLGEADGLNLGDCVVFGGDWDLRRLEVFDDLVFCCAILDVGGCCREESRL